jgi:hypothetical protein
MKKKIFPVLLLLLFFGCIRAPADVPKSDGPIQECFNLCKKELEKGIDLTNGPCIGNPLAEYPDYVCDIAHNPRKEIDNQQENQCSAFREGKAKHFVELDKECNFIKKY